MQIYWTAALAFGIIIALFAVQNSSPTTIRFLWMYAENVPVSVLVMISAALGALVTLMLGLAREVRLGWGRMRARRAAGALERRVAELEKAVEQVTAEKAALQSELDVVTGKTPRYEAVPVDTPAVGQGGATPSLPSGEPPSRP
jgi:uncharacterized integral membrane protein